MLPGVTGMLMVDFRFSVFGFRFFFSSQGGADWDEEQEGDTEFGLG